MTQAARGTTYTWTAYLRDAADALVDCADLTLSIADPDGDVLAGFPVSISPIVRDDLGTYHYAWSIPSDAALGMYDADWAGTGDVDGLAYGGSDSVEVVEPGTISAHVISVDAVRAQVETDLTDSELGAAIDREAAWLARRIGALTGSRTQTFYVRDVDLDDPLTLRRPTDDVAVTDNGTILTSSQVRLLGDGRIVERADASWAGPTVEATYTPNDAEEVDRVLIELVRLTTGETGYESEQIGQYRYSRGGVTNTTQTTAGRRTALLRDLMPAAVGRIRLRSSVRPERIGEVA